MLRTSKLRAECEEIISKYKTDKYEREYKNKNSFFIFWGILLIRQGYDSRDSSDWFPTERWQVARDKINYGVCKWYSN